jgi:hypothetical protein
MTLLYRSLMEEKGTFVKNQVNAAPCKSSSKVLSFNLRELLFVICVVKLMTFFMLVR